MMNPEPVRNQFRHRFSMEPRLFWAPGRVNLIGEHTDYNEGLVFPAALSLGTLVAAAARPDRTIRAISLNGEQHQFDLDRPGERPAPASFAAFVEGMARELDPPLTGANLMVSGDLPIGAGLSSSASLEVAVGWALLALAGRTVDGLQLAKAAQAAEHRWVGTLCGLMDQFIAVHGKPNRALLLDTRDLSYQAVPMPADLELLVIDTGVKHALAGSEYNLRRQECAQAAALLKRSSLRDAPLEEVEALPEPLRRRARHVVSEDLRTRAFARAIQENDPRAIGTAMAGSHASLRDDYQVSCPELDALVELATGAPGVVGARMTGGGFGGSTLTLVRRGHANEVAARVGEGYQRRFGRLPSAIVSPAARGAGELQG
jgi:galactokinase